MVTARFASRCYVLLGVITVGICLCVNYPSRAQGNGPHVNYMLHCQGCHLPGGIGHPGIVPAMKDSVARFLNVKGGREYLVQVPGVAQSSLDDASLAEVLNWIMPTFDPRHMPDKFVPFTAEEVANYRPTKLRNVSEIRQRLLRQLMSEGSTDAAVPPDYGQSASDG